ncbi:hypothetical protein Goklo_028930 [Gossypium klotzschianum]|uniref:Uncharacterized protein n=1 Tax=Gossypium klotzschianum TaxID=34286 RepID=A0A7J8U344_9ROSI|nr:hypothetical protein [Gossypium klotzschianum]
MKGKKRNRGWTRGNVVPNPSQGDSDTRASIIRAQHNRVGRSVEKRLANDRNISVFSLGSHVTRREQQLPRPYQRRRRNSETLDSTSSRPRRRCLCHLIAPGLDLKGFSFLFKTWNKCASGQIATFSGCFHSKKYLTGGLSSMEIFSWFHLSIALSAQSLFKTQSGKRNASFFRDRC